MREEYEEYLNKKYQKNYDIHQSPGFTYKPALSNFGLYQTQSLSSINPYNLSDNEKLTRERIKNVIFINGEGFYFREGKMFRVYHCDYPGCYKKYMSKYSLKYHLDKGHSPDSLDANKPYACNFGGCTKRYKNKSTLVKHLEDSHFIKSKKN